MTTESKVRVVMIEASGSDAVMAQALAGFLRALDGAGESAEVAAPLPALESEVRRDLRSAPKRLAAPATTRVKRARQASLPLKPPTNGASVGDAGTRVAVLRALEKRPMTSGEVIQETGLSAPAVYTMLGVMRKEGTVEARDNEDGIGRKNHLVKR